MAPVALALQHGGVRVILPPEAPPAVIAPALAYLPTLVDRAATALAGARTAAEILEARERAGLAYDAAKRAARLANAKGAHDALVAAAHRAQADALEIEAQAKRRLADEYDAAQARGEVAGRTGGGERSGLERSVPTATAADLGLTRGAIHDARQVRDAEAAEPGIVRRALDAALRRGAEPSRASLRRAVESVARHGYRPPRASRRNPLRVHDAAFERVASIAGACRTLVDNLGRYDLDDIMAGCSDAGMRARTLADLRTCRARLDDLMRPDDAPEA